MTITETDLPGVGKKHEVDLDDESTLVIVTHNTGKREIYLRTEPEQDSEKLFELSDELARTIGTLLEGAYFQPVASEKVETVLADETLLEWFNVAENAEIVGETLASADVGRRTGVNVVAIQREGDVVPEVGPDTQILAGDTVVVIGSREACEDFETLIGGPEPDGPSTENSAS